MSVSKHKKKSTHKKTIRKITNAILTKSKPNIRIKREQFVRLRNDNDFINLVKMGRLINAVAFGAQCMHDYMRDKSPVGKRQYHRALFITGGYLFEGIALIESMRLKYHAKDYFKKLNEVAFGEHYKSKRKILKEMRHSVAFHLDSKDKSTRTALSKLNLARYDLTSSEPTQIMDFYFVFADTVDIRYLVEFFKGNKTEEQVAMDIMTAVADVMKEFIFAGHEFLGGLATEMNLSDHTE